MDLLAKYNGKEGIIIGFFPSGQGVMAIFWQKWSTSLQFPFAHLCEILGPYEQEITCDTTSLAPAVRKFLDLDEETLEEAARIYIDKNFGLLSRYTSAVERMIDCFKAGATYKGENYHD